jgi:hypothetical protein
VKLSEEQWIADKIPLIIPPTSEKTGFYHNLIVRSLWGLTGNHIRAGLDIYCVGYSFPESDRILKKNLEYSLFK